MSGKPHNPFVGPRPLTCEEAIHGRTEEIAELDYLLGAERIVLLHSPSGAGKSSLVNAGLIPRVRGRYDVWGPTRVNLEPDLEAPNRYVYSAAMGFEQDIPEDSGRRREPATIASQTLSEYVARRPRRKNARPDTLLLLDQFEEILTTDPVDVAAKRAFFTELGELLRDPTIWALFISREDYLAPLEPYAQLIPTHLLNRFRIDRLTSERAAEVMIRTAEDSGPGGRRFTKDAAERLVGDLAKVKVQQADGTFAEQQGRYVEPVQLQVVCRGLWERMPDDDLQVDPEDIDKYGDVSGALGDYYAQSLRKATDGNTADERKIRQWFNDRLITSGGIRGQVLREESQSGGLDNTLIEALRDTHLLRAERRGGATWFELAHDRLVEPVREDNERWKEEHLSEVQRRAELWAKEDKPESLLSVEADLRAAEQWAKSVAESSGVLTEEEEQFLEACRKKQAELDEKRRQAEREQRQAAKIKRFAVAVSAVAVVAVVALIGAWLAQREAERQKETAQDLGLQAIGRALLEARSTRSFGILAEVGRPRPWDAHLAALPMPFRITLEGHQAAVSSASFSPDGRRIVTASGDNTARIWNAADGALLAALEGHTGYVSSASFSPDGERIVTASFDDTARIWNAVEGTLLAALEGHTGYVSSASFSPDGRRIVTASGDKTARIWPGTDQFLLSLVRSKSEACLDADFRRVQLGEDQELAESQERACQACLPRFFQDLDDADISSRPYATEPYLEAWRRYQDCLAAEGWDD